MDGRRHVRGEIATGLLIFLAVVAVFILIVVVVAVFTSAPPPASPAAGNGDSGQVPGTNTCFSYCLGVVEMECGSNKVMQACLGVWDCTGEYGAHTCLR